MNRKIGKRGLFVTGTDTGVGKTVVAAGLVRLARNRGLRAIAVKPVETGCVLRQGMLFPEDGALLQEASEHDLTLDECVPFRFSLPASPARAAAMEGRNINPTELLEHILTLAETADLTIVEGAGGLMVPVHENVLMIDLILKLGFPVVLVARTKLGTVNHTLLSLEVLRGRGIEVAGVILSGTANDMGPEEHYTPQDLARLVGDVPLVVLPHLDARKAYNPLEIARAMTEKWEENLIQRWIGPDNDCGR